MSTAIRAESVWQLQTAKAKFSNLVKKAMEAGPQLVTKAGQPAVYIVDAQTFESEVSENAKRRKDILLSSPHRDTVLELEREKDEGREMPL